MSRNRAAHPEASTPMSKWLVLPLIVVAYIATSVTAASPRDRDHDRPPDRRERQHQLSTKFRSAGRDPDHARLNNRPELRLRTHPRRAFPSPATTGVPGGWTPARTVSADMTINTPGAVVQDILFTSGADIVVNAPNVTIRRVKLQGGVITSKQRATLLANRLDTWEFYRLLSCSRCSDI